MQNVKKTKYPFIKLFLVQALVAVVLVGLVFVVKKVSAAEYSAVEQRYADVMENEQSAQSVQKTWSKIKAFFVDENNRPITENAGGKDEDANGNRYPDNCSASKYIISEDICRPAQGEISSPFGYRIHPLSGKLSFHTGIDIAAKNGSAVKAAYYGVVESAQSDEVYGNCLRINHGNGICTFYAHCAVLTVKVGDVVQAGDCIAKVGSTGWSTGPHLHFGILINNVYYNPAYVIK